MRCSVLVFSLLCDVVSVARVWCCDVSVAHRYDDSAVLIQSLISCVVFPRFLPSLPLALCVCVCVCVTGMGCDQGGEGK